MIITMLILSYFILVIVLMVLVVRIERLWSASVLLFLLTTLYLLYQLGLNTIIIWLIAGLLLLLYLALIPRFIRLLWLKPLVSKLSKSIKIGISQTEKIAIKCGDTHWEKHLFTNQLDWAVLLSAKSKPLSQEELDFIADKVPKLCLTFGQYGLSQTTLNQIKTDGFWGLSIAKQYGGLGFCNQAHAQILIQLSSCDVSLAVTVMVPNSLGPAELIAHYGSDEQKQNLLPKLATGEHIPCFALTSTDAGSDAAAMTDTGVVCYGDYQGKNTLGILLNWQKRYTTLAPIATLIGLAFKTNDPDGLLGGQSSLGITCALIDSSLAGITIGRCHHPIGANFSNGPHQGHNVFIPITSVIGGEKMIGQGWRILMESLSLGRGVSLPSLSLAGCQLALKTSIEYSLLRKQFRQSLYKFQGISEKIVSMSADVLAMKAMSNLHLDLLDGGLNPAISSAILKYHHTQTLREHINHAMDIHGGKAVMTGSKNYLASCYQSIPIAITVEGANILTRSMIIFGQGLMRCHPFLKDELLGVENHHLLTLNDLLGKHITYSSLSAIKSFMFALTKGKLATMPAGVSKTKIIYYQQLSSISASFAFLVEMALINHRQNIKFKESINGLFSDLLINMSAISAILKFEQTLSACYDNLVDYALQKRLYQSQLLLANITRQLKFKSLLKWLILPRGVNYLIPTITLQDNIMTQLINDKTLKQGLTNDVFIDDENHPLGQLDKAYNLGLIAEKIYHKIGFVDNISMLGQLLDEDKINQDEYQLLTTLGKLRTSVLSVDDYEN